MADRRERASGPSSESTPADATRRALGAEGEARAAAFLAAQGYRVLARNARAGRVELDLVAARGRVLVVAEVKTRRTRSAGAPEEAVDFRKRARLVQGAAAWLAEHPGRWSRVRFDVIACEWDAARGWSLRHLEGAVDAND